MVVSIEVDEQTGDEILPSCSSEGMTAHDRNVRTTQPSRGNHYLQVILAVDQSRVLVVQNFT